MTLVSPDPLTAANAIIAQQADEMARLQTRITDLERPYLEHDAEMERLLPPHRHPGSTGQWIDRLRVLREERDRLLKATIEADAALQEIHDFAHCTAKAGPLHTKTLDEAWGKFMRLSVMVTQARSLLRSPRRVPPLPFDGSQVDTAGMTPSSP